MSQPLQSPGTQAATVARQAHEGTSQLVASRGPSKPLKGGDVGYRMGEKHSTIMKIQTMPGHFCRYCIFFDTVKLSWIFFSKKSCVEDLFENLLLLYKRFCFHLRSPWKISSCRCLLSPFIARSLGRTCRFRRSSHREPVVVAGRGILPRKETNIPWKWIIGRWNGPWKWIGRWNGKYPLEDEISFWNGSFFWWGHVNFWGEYLILKWSFGVWILFHIWSIHTFQEQIGDWNLIMMFNDMMSIPRIKVRWAHALLFHLHLPPAIQQDPTTGSKHCQREVLGTSAHAVAVILSKDKPSND